MRKHEPIEVHWTNKFFQWKIICTSACCLPNIKTTAAISAECCVGCNVFRVVERWGWSPLISSTYAKLRAMWLSGKLFRLANAVAKACEMEACPILRVVVRVARSAPHGRILLLLLVETSQLMQPDLVLSEAPHASAQATEFCPSTLRSFWLIWTKVLRKCTPLRTGLVLTYNQHTFHDTCDCLRQTTDEFIAAVENCSKTSTDSRAFRKRSA